uniref:Uncharacterized protein n=1 Tax=Avena sativa TaxID=4498 RepID=A0ACD5VAY1_AVESA
MDGVAAYCCLLLLLALLPLVYTSIRSRTRFLRLRVGRGSGSGSHHGGGGPRPRLPPGPWRLPVIGSVHHLVGALPHRALQGLSRRHGPLMLLKLGEVPVMVASSAEAAREIMKTQDHVLCTRPLSSCAGVLNERGHGITFAPYGDKWRQMRKVCIQALLNARCVGSFRRVREEAAVRFVRSIVVSALDQLEPVNLSRMIAAYGMDTTVHSVMGRRFKEQDALLHYVDEAVRVVSQLTVSDMFPSWRLLRGLSGTLRRAVAFRDSSLAFMDRVICDHLESRRRRSAAAVRRLPEEEDDVINVLLKIQRDQGNDLQFPLTMDNVKAVLFDILAGGSEAPVTTLQWAMAELMQNPSVMSRAQAEVRGVFTVEGVTEEGLGQLSYLHCVIKETLRLHTPGPMLLPRECQEPCTVLGYDVPRGTILLVNAWAISRDSQYWDQPEAFLPDRFMATTTDYKGNHFEFTPFGAGWRICPGMLFGLANIELALASLLFYFDWALPDGLLPGGLDMTEAMGITARRKEDLRVHATLRVPLP